MNRVDADRLKRMPPDTFEKYLPYAMALGVEHHWAQAFAGIIQNPPNWYVSPNGMTGFNPIFFLQFDAQHGVGHAPGVRLRAAFEFERFRLWRRRWIVGRRFRRRRRKRFLGGAGAPPSAFYEIPYDLDQRPRARAPARLATA